MEKLVWIWETYSEIPWRTAHVMSKVIIIWSFSDSAPIGMRTMLEDSIGIPIAVPVTRRILPSCFTLLRKYRCHLTNRMR
jgi:hypothetical protein